jgi:RNA polymerase sigma factor (sigma-70 family)
VNDDGGRPAPGVAAAGVAAGHGGRAERETDADAAFAQVDIERVLATHGPALRRLVAAYERDRATQQDLLQEILLALWRALPRFRGDCAERTFVLRVAHNRSLTHAFRRPPRPAPLDEAGEIADPLPGPEHHAVTAQRRAALLRALHELPLAPRQILTLSLEGLGNVEIAELLGITPNNANVRLSRARSALRDAMARNGGSP